MSSLFETVLHIPEGINFDCTGCGNCCFHWPVPLTTEDLERIDLLVGNADKPKFRRLQASVDKLRAFTHSLGKDAQGRCQYLDEDIRCRLHKNFGMESKPSMCQLFPYTFTITPTGAYASLSFASTGVLLNSGASLTAQKEYLQKQLALFMKLFPVEPDWSKIQLVDGVPIRWVDFLLIDKVLLESIHPRKSNSLSRENLLAQSKFIISKLPAKVDLENAHLTRVRPILVDQILLKLLYELYFVNDVYSEGIVEFDAKQFLNLLAQQPQSLSLNFLHSGRLEPISFKAIVDYRLAEKAGADFENLLIRMMFCRLFSKLYFGPGFGGLSLLSGFHHLLLIICLVRIHLKMAALTNNADAFDLNWQYEQIRSLERRLTVVSLSKESHAILEVLLQSPARIERILSLSA